MAIAGVSPTIQPRTPQGVFANEPFTDFNDSENARAMRHALDEVAVHLGSDYPLIIGGKRLRTAERIRSINPARPAQIVGVHQKAGAAQVEPAMSAALRAFDSWSKVPVEVRASLLLNAADVIRKRKFEFMAWLTYEVGKNWAEADADVGETIDFLEFYAREALRLAAATTPIQYPGERDELLYIPLGVGAVIPPWNFPFAIMAGMTAAAIVTGNTVILKPSSDAPTIAARFVEVLEEAGMPDGVVNFCPGSGATFGNAIVDIPKPASSPSPAPGPSAWKFTLRAAQPQPGQIWIKRTILEMGGKDSILVAADADLDAAIEGVVASAFGFSGQKCSACSSAIIEAPLYDVFVERLRERVATLTVGDPASNPNLGPVINQAALNSMLGYIETGKKEGQSDCRRPRAGNQRWWLLPGADHLLRSPAQRSASSGRNLRSRTGAHQGRQLRRGICAWPTTPSTASPALSTRTIPSKRPPRGSAFHVGNLYFNRKCTGAMVGAHPFGGFNMSGTDSKAGGPDYLTLFTQAKSIAEKLTEPVS